MIAQSLPETLALTVNTLPQTMAASSLSPALSITAPDDPNLRISAAGLASPTPPNGALPLPTNTPGPSTPTPRPGQTPGGITITTASPSATPTPTATRAPSTTECDKTQSSIFCVYTVQANDTLSGIAAKFALKGNDDVASWELLVNSNKPDIVSEDDLLQIGQKLRIPTGGVAIAAVAGPSGSASTPAAGPLLTSATAGSVIHTVLSAQTISDIADLYDVTSASIIAANKLSNPDALTIGQEILVPNPKRFAKPAPIVAAAPSPADRAAGGSTSSGPTSVAIGARSNVGFMWPASGPISSYFSASHPLGIDIDLFNNPNAPIAAVKSGTVTFAGGSTCCSYGLYVIVDHGGGFQTLYAHLSSLSVSAGQSVSQGQVIGKGGHTGYATGNHLHFEVHLNGSVVNPLSYLP